MVTYLKLIDYHINKTDNMDYDNNTFEEMNKHGYNRLCDALDGLDKVSDDVSQNKYYVDIRVEIPDIDADIIEDAVDIGREFVDLLVEQEENKLYNIYLKKIGSH